MTIELRAAARTYTCNVGGCERSIPPSRLMCPTHWSLVPYRLKRDVLRAYEADREAGRRSSREHLEACAAAIRAVAGAEVDGRYRRG